MSASVYSMEMKVFVYANVSWAMGGKEAVLDGRASSMSPEMEREKLGAQVCVCGHGGWGRWGTVSHRKK